MIDSRQKRGKLMKKIKTQQCCVLEVLYTERRAVEKSVTSHFCVSLFLVKVNEDSIHLLPTLDFRDSSLISLILQPRGGKELGLACLLCHPLDPASLHSSDSDIIVVGFHCRSPSAFHHLKRYIRRRCAELPQINASLCSWDYKIDVQTLTSVPHCDSLLNLGPCSHFRTIITVKNLREVVSFSYNQ